jgi:hypothetical protein
MATSNSALHPLWTVTDRPVVVQVASLMQATADCCRLTVTSAASNPNWQVLDEMPDELQVT